MKEWTELPNAFRIPFGCWTFINLFHSQSPHPLQRTILPILVRREGSFEVAGTAFGVGPDVFLTATHTLVTDGKLRVDEAYLLFVGGTYADGSFMGGPVPIRKVNFIDSTDIALLWAPLPTVDGRSLRNGLIPLDLREPAIGAPCVAIGYTAGVKLDPGAARPPWTLTVTPKLNASEGTVEEILHEGRDRSFLRFPVLRMSARIDHQMSGSPILSGPEPGRHQCVGVVASAIDLGRSRTFTSYGSLVWPAAALRLAFDDAGSLREYSLLELAEREFVFADYQDGVRVEENEVSGWSVRYRASPPPPFVRTWRRDVRRRFGRAWNCAQELSRGVARWLNAIQRRARDVAFRTNTDPRNL